MNFRDLNYIVAVAQTRSFVQAAEKCFVSQPTLSTQIKKLENDLGVKLFERSNKRVLLTTVGQTIVASAQSILDEVEHMKALADNAQNPFSGELKLGAFPSLASYFFPGIVTTIKQALPKIKLILIEEKTADLIKLLELGEIDAAFLSLPLKEDFLLSQFLFEDPFRLAVANDHAFANKKFISPSDLHKQSLLLLNEGHCLRDQALQFCQWNNAQEQIGVRASSLETLRQMVMAGTGMTLMPEIAINKEDKMISYIPFSEPIPKRSIGLTWRKSSVREQLISRLLELISAQIKTGIHQPS